MAKQRKRETARKRKQRTRIDDLNIDVFNIVMIFLSQSCSGEKSLVRAASVCKRFKEAAEDKEVLRSVNFKNISLFAYPASFWNTRGFLHKCAGVGNDSARKKIMEYVEMRFQYTYNKAILTDIAEERYLKAEAAREVVNTRARDRAVSLAKKVYDEWLTDQLKDQAEISEQLKAFNIVIVF